MNEPVKSTADSLTNESANKPLDARDAHPFLSVVVPAYNEADRIDATLIDMHHYLRQQAYTWEIIVVIDGATDETVTRVRDFAAGKPQVSWIDRRENQGKGFTVRQGMRAARGTIRLFTDADNSTRISHLDAMLPLFEAGRDVVIGSRDSKDVPGAQQAVPQPFAKRVLGNLGNLFIQLVAVPGIWDTQCGFKAFTSESAERIFSVARVNRWGFDIEALALARHFGCSIAIIPAHWVDDERTHVRTSDYLQTVVDTLRIRWRLVRGVYGSAG